MRHFEGSRGTSFTYHGDFSGSVTITTDHVDVDHLGYSVVKQSTLTVPFEDLKELVAAYIRSKRLEKLENATTEEILG